MAESTQVVRWLRDEFAERVERNPRYSLRAFARSLSVSHTLLSLVLNGHRSPSAQFVRRLNSEIGSPPRARPVAEITAAAAPTDEKEIPQAEFARIADWVHYGVLGLLALPGFRLSARETARRLGVSHKRAEMAIEDLKTLGYVRLDRGRWRQCVPPLRVDQSRPTAASQRFIRSLLDRAKEAMDEVPFERRSLTSITFAMAAEDVPYAVEKIREFRRSLSHELESRTKPDSVYALTVQLVPLTRDGARASSSDSQEKDS